MRPRCRIEGRIQVSGLDEASLQDKKVKPWFLSEREPLPGQGLQAEQEFPPE
ncbi:MAG: hypothetical protein K5989_06425 [Lachnospiraceae bacterium]|nr:hypothetical protein [Lachnospiraceae bacterium]